ncbi:MAG: hypothetical protein ACJAZO_003008 [Myxococcota bacterium]|jgi:hypothetical protein
MAESTPREAPEYAGHLTPNASQIVAVAAITAGRQAPPRTSTCRAPAALASSAPSSTRPAAPKPRRERYTRVTSGQVAPNFANDAARQAMVRLVDLPADGDGLSPTSVTRPPGTRHRFAGSCPSTS